MDETGDTTGTAVEEFGGAHKVARYFVGGLAAFVADDLATKAYDAAIRWNRARKSS